MSRALYATDASVYQIEPIGVAMPRSRSDLIRLVRHLCRVPLPDHHARWRDLASRTGDRARPGRRHVEVSDDPARSERRRTLGPCRARYRPRRAERPAAPARTAVRARRLHGEPRHDRRHDGQQFERRPVGDLRQDHRSRPRAGSRAVEWLGDACSDRSMRRNWPGSGPRRRSKVRATGWSAISCHNTATRSIGGSRECCAASAGTTSTSS